MQKHNDKGIYINAIDYNYFCNDFRDKTVSNVANTEHLHKATNRLQRLRNCLYIMLPPIGLKSASYFDGKVTVDINRHKTTL